MWRELGAWCLYLARSVGTIGWFMLLVVAVAPVLYFSGAYDAYHEWRKLAVFAAAYVACVLVRPVVVRRRLRRQLAGPTVSLSEIRRLAGSPSSEPGRDVSIGLVLVQGKARGLSSVKAPLSGREGIGYRMVARWSSFWSRQWDARQYIALVPFEIVDGSESALVRDTSALLILKPQTAQTLSKGAVVHQELCDGSVPAGSRCTEHLLEDGEPVFVRGMASLESGGGGRPRVVLSAPQDKLGLIIANQSQEHFLRSLGVTQEIPAHLGGPKLPRDPWWTDEGD